MNPKESRDFLRGQMAFTPARMMRYIRSRARLSTDEDIEDILQNALVLVTQHFDPSHPDANLALYCLGACNKAIAQNLERYHKVILRKREDTHQKRQVDATQAEREVSFEGASMQVKTLVPGKSFEEDGSSAGQFRTTSLDSLFEEEGRGADDILGLEYKLSGNGIDEDPAARALMKDLIQRILAELPPGIHRTCFLLKYVQGHKREDLIACLKMDAKSIDTVDKKIVRTLKSFKEKLDQEELRI